MNIVNGNQVMKNVVSVFYNDPCFWFTIHVLDKNYV